MCNQWGEKGYFFDGVRPVLHMDKDHLTYLMRSQSPQDSYINIHGGEPFVYKHFDLLLELLQEKPFGPISGLSPFPLRIPNHNDRNPKQKTANSSINPVYLSFLFITLSSNW
jgi:hypothetical protein